MAPQFRLPDDTQRVAIVGRTGSGKTVAALWQLSLRSYDTRPWIVFDFKGDRNIARIPRARVVSINEPPPKTPGVFIVRPLPHQNDELDDYLWRIWSQENTGLYFDEGYMVSKSEPFRALLTQGRSKNIPLIVLTQRPVWITRFVWSESDFIQLFSLSNLQDRKVMRDMLPKVPTDLPAYHSIWHDVGKDASFLLRPAPRIDTIRATFRSRAVRPYEAF